MTHELSLWVKKILILLAIIAGLYVLWSISNILLVLMIAGFMTMVVNPLITLGEARKIPSWLTLIGVYIIMFLL
jgi:predicted PurR-regulated permease PerM